jgi:hypothetical protein
MWLTAIAAIEVGNRADRIMLESDLPFKLGRRDVLVFSLLEAKAFAVPGRQNMHRPTQHSRMWPCRQTSPMSG